MSENRSVWRLAWTHLLGGNRPGAASRVCSDELKRDFGGDRPISSAVRYGARSPAHLGYPGTRLCRNGRAIIPPSRSCSG